MIPEMVHGMIYDAQIGLDLSASASMFDFEYKHLIAYICCFSHLLFNKGLICNTNVFFISNNSKVLFGLKRHSDMMSFIDYIKMP